MNKNYIIYIVAIAVISYFVYTYVNKKPESEAPTEGGNEDEAEARKAAAAIAEAAARIAAEKAAADAITAANNAAILLEQQRVSASAAADAYARLNNPAATNIGNQYPMWINKPYLTSEYVIYNNNLYKNTQQITTTNNQTPDKDNRWQKFIL